MNREETAIHRPSSNTRQAMWAWFLVGTSRSAVRGKQCFERYENTYVKCLGYDFFSLFYRAWLPHRPRPMTPQSMQNNFRKNC